MKNNRENNKGFTLVELIIVIAVLGILMVALVPQYIQYVERARESNDVQVAKSFATAVEIAVIDPQNGVTASDTFTITWDAGDTGTVEATNTTGSAYSAVLTEVAEVMGIDTTDSTTFILPESKNGDTDFTIQIIDGEVQTPSWTGVDSTVLYE